MSSLTWSQRSVCCMDAENYLQLPVSQFEEDNVLRELNKAVLAFRQQAPPQPCQPVTRRLSPIGESFSSTPPEGDAAKQQVHVSFLNEMLITSIAEANSVSAGLKILKSKSSLPCSHKPTPCSCPEPKSCKWSLPFRFCDQNFVRRF